MRKYMSKIIPTKICHERVKDIDTIDEIEKTVSN